MCLIMLAATDQQWLFIDELPLFRGHTGWFSVVGACSTWSIMTKTALADLDHAVRDGVRAYPRSGAGASAEALHRNNLMKP